METLRPVALSDFRPVTAEPVAQSVFSTVDQCEALVAAAASDG